ncbi:hypothetical protein [Natronobiforma cellulositropha]|uniref:hypothetical protein n=1 Tax=Natronobiforma cellulositropha TaxID=1679076 RepID=UPI0021D61351|nr:hypothetical protein [Natronobiforma cellulositropha]
MFEELKRLDCHEIKEFGSGESLDGSDFRWEIALLEAPHWDNRDENLEESDGGKLISHLWTTA